MPSEFHWYHVLVLIFWYIVITYIFLKVRGKEEDDE